MYGVDDVKRTEGPLKENQPDHREKGIQGRAPWTWQRRWIFCPCKGNFLKMPHCWLCSTDISEAGRHSNSLKDQKHEWEFSAVPYWWSWRLAQNSGESLVNIPTMDRTPWSFEELNLQETKGGWGSARDAVQTIPNRSKTEHSSKYDIRNIIEKYVFWMNNNL